jgi:hypothetical protein
MLEDTVEEMNSTFANFTDNLLQSQHVQTQPHLVASVGDTIKQLLTLTERAMRDPADDFEGERLEDLTEALTPVKTADSSSFPRHPQYLDSTRVDNVDTEVDPMQRYVDGEFAAGQHVSSSTALMTQSQSAPMPQNAFFTKEFWSGDYTNYTSALPGEYTPIHFPFWERLLRTTVAIGYHCLNGDRGYSHERAKRQYRYTLSHESPSFILAVTRAVMGRFQAYGEAYHPSYIDAQGEHRGVPTVGRPRATSYFAFDQTRMMGLATQQAMINDGFPIDHLIDAESVEEYLRSKGLVQVDGNVMQAEMTVTEPRDSKGQANATSGPTISLSPPSGRNLLADSDAQVAPSSTNSLRQEKTASRKTRSVQKRRTERRLVTVSISSLIEKFADLSICTGSGVGFPACLLNTAIVASVIKIGD